MQNNIRHLLVVDDDDDKSNLSKPVGIITPLDFTRYWNTIYENLALIHLLSLDAKKQQPLSRYPIHFTTNTGHDA
jgi:hypothetical protein